MALLSPRSGPVTIRLPGLGQEDERRGVRGESRQHEVHEDERVGVELRQIAHRQFERANRRRPFVSAQGAESQSSGSDYDV